MEYKKSMIIIILAIFLFSIASVCASDVNDTAIASEDTTAIELSQSGEITTTDESQKTIQTNDTEMLTASDEETTVAQNNLDTLSLEEKTYADLSNAVGSGGNINLQPAYYKYNGESDTITITNPGIINGNGAIIDMAGSTIRAFTVNTEGVTINNLTIKNANINGNGGAIYFSNSGTVSNCNFTGNTAYYGGAVLFNSNGNVTNCNFTGNTATGDGGAIEFDGTGTVTNCNFTNNHATVDGGAVYFNNYGNVTNCNFTDNHAVDGGAIMFVSTGEVSNCNFTNNSASSRGGAVYFSSTGNVSNCNFTGNTATYAGGAVYFNGNGEVTNCNFADNKATGTNSWGGAIMFVSTGEVSNCNFTANQATIGGAVYFTGTGDVRNCNFTGNTVTGTNSWGGAVYFNNYGNVTNCNFTNNHANHGGAVCFNKGGNVSNCNFTGNTATGSTATDSNSWGGAIRMNSGTVSNCNFTGNTATGSTATDSNSWGGAINIGSGTVSNCNFTGNKATGPNSWGGAVYFFDTGEVKNCNFTNNHATVEGGAVYFDSDGDVRNCNFTNNHATVEGGAVYFNNYGNVTNCNFTDNAAYDGGAIRFHGEGNVTNCNFTDNAAYDGGAIRFNGEGNVTNCNFTGNTATGDGGAINIGSGTVSNCNFTDNEAYYGGAIRMNSGTVSNCNFTGNKATGTNSWGGAVYFIIDGDVRNCNFTDNEAYNGGAVYFQNTGTVSNCNFTANHAATGSAIYFYGTSATKTVSNSRFLNNRANAETLEVIKNDNNITITFTGQNNLLNAIYSRDNAEVTFNNVTYWGKNGITTISTTKSGFNKEEGQNITVGVVVNDKLVLSEVMVTDENGQIVLDISAGENYYISARHDADSYYTEAEKTISNNTKFNANVTSQTTTNKTVNITAKSNIYSEVLPGKLLFILPNSEEISANYNTDGTWWAVHKFDDYTIYRVNASYTGLDNVTVNNGTITINKPDSTIMLDDITLNYGESKNVTVTTTGATEITAIINGTDVTVINNYTIPISGLAAGNYTLNVTTVPDGDHNSVSKEVKIIVYKATAEITVDSATMDIKVLDEVLSGATLTPADAGNLTYKSNNETVVIVKDGKIKALAKGTATITVSFAGNENYTAAENKTINVTVNLKDAIISVNNSTLNLFTLLMKMAMSPL